MTTTGFRRMSLLVPLAVTSILLAACGSSSSSGGGSSTAPTSLEGTAWVLATYTAAGGGSTPAEAEPAATLAFSPASRLEGSTGCNSFGGEWTQDGSSITLSPGPTTKKACPGALAAQETAVLANLDRAATYAIVSGALRLSAADGTELMSYLPGLSGLADTAWTATEVNNGKGGLASVPAGVTVTAEFAADGKLSGNGGCNGYGSTWTVSADALTLGPISASAMACPDPAGATESQYFAALGNVATYEISGRTLTLRDKDGAAQVTYQLA
jgi:heat shock protein HslJ